MGLVACDNGRGPGWALLRSRRGLGRGGRDGQPALGQLRGQPGRQPDPVTFRPAGRTCLVTTTMSTTSPGVTPT
jgi:hypothetical protein